MHHIADVIMVYHALSHAGVHLFVSTYYGQGTGPIVFNYLDCDGSESRLEDCYFDMNAYYFSHSYDVGLHCYEQGIQVKIFTQMMHIL